MRSYQFYTVLSVIREFFLSRINQVDLCKEEGFSLRYELYVQILLKVGPN
jgi:hypothetical protein